MSKIKKDTVTVTNGAKKFEAAPAHAEYLLTRGYKLAEGEVIPTGAEQKKAEQKVNIGVPLTRKQLEGLSEPELQKIYLKLRGVPSGVDHNKAKLIEDIIIAQEELAKKDE